MLLRFVQRKSVKCPNFLKQIRSNTTSEKVKSSTDKSINVNVTGLSNKVVNVPSNEVGPGASKASNYKNPEYFCYNRASYFEAEIEMAKYRLPQPSAKKV